MRPQTLGQSYRTFYDRNLGNFRNQLVFVPGKPLHASSMFAGKVRAYLSEAPFRCSTLGYVPRLTLKH